MRYIEWYSSMAELAAIYGEMCAINETPRKDQTKQQTDRLNVLRKECIVIHHKRILMNLKNERK
jgi:membrane protein insertase Oxa1/YidC/SpoIIIJ